MNHACIIMHARRDSGFRMRGTGNGSEMVNLKKQQEGESSLVKKEMIAMLLAGGQGSRLGVLTQKVAKPAMPGGGNKRTGGQTKPHCL